VTLTGGSTSLPDDLWPTTYAVDFNPTGGPVVPIPVVVRPGQPITVVLTIPAAKMTVTGGPPALTSVVLVPTGTPCLPASRRVVPTGFSLLPGTWDLYADGSGYTCSAGPTAVVVVSGATVVVPWTPTTLQVTGPIDPRVLRAAPAGTTTVPGCPTTAAQTTALVLTAAQTGPQPVPAGTWYLYWANSTGTCQTGVGQVVVPYGHATTYTMVVGP
jgi:hypothetical protein